MSQDQLNQHLLQQLQEKEAVIRQHEDEARQIREQISRSQTSQQNLDLLSSQGDYSITPSVPLHDGNSLPRRATVGGPTPRSKSNMGVAMGSRMKVLHRFCTT
jgi:hypothetical protein